MKTSKLVFLALLCLCVQSSFAQNGHLTAHSVVLKNAGNQVYKLNPADSLHVWGLASLMGSDTISADHHSNLEVIYSSDGGIHWLSHSIAGTSVSDSFGVCNLWPVSATTCYLALYSTAGNTGGGKVIRTTDSGTTWQNVNIGNQAFAGGFLNFIFFFTPDSGIAVGDPNGGYFEIYTTSNAGQNWNRINTASIPDTLSGETGLTDRFTYSGNSIYFPTVKNRVFYSNDKGATWQVKDSSFLSIVNTALSTNLQINNTGDVVMSASGTKYYYSNDLGKTKSLFSYPQTINRTYFSPFRTKTDNAFLNTAYWLSAGIIDSMYLYICSDSPSVHSNWKNALSVSTTSSAFIFDQLSSRNYFYSQNLGWLAGYWIDSIAANTCSQIIYRYENCAATAVTFNLPDTICSNASLPLSPYAQPPGGWFYPNLYDTEITNFTPADYMSDIAEQDSVFFLQYVYANNGCYSQAVDFARITECDATGINEATAEPAITVYPNPAQQQIYVRGTWATDQYLSITDITGRILLSQKQTDRTINISTLASGVYFITLNTSENFKTVKFIKE